LKAREEVKREDFRAGLKALEEMKREGYARGRIQGWTDTIDLKAPEQLPTTLADEPTATPIDKGKRRDDGGDIAAPEDVDRGRRPLTPQQLGVSAAEATVGKKTDADDRTSRHSNRPSSARGSKPPSEKDRGGKAGNWLTDRTMFPHDVHRAQVWGFDYKSLDPTQSVDSPAKKKPDYEKYLHETAEALLALIVRQTRENTPLIFVATGFGCLVVQKLMALEHADWILPISGVLFFDAPSPILKEKPKTEKVKTTPAPAAPAPTAPVAAAPDPTAPDTTAPVSTAFLSTFPAPANSARANRLRAILDSKGIDSWDLWEGFHLLINERGLPMVWFYNQAQLPKNVGAHSLLPRSPFPVWLYSRN
jgi:predicted alpha/beta hydrolase family esterase